MLYLLKNVKGKRQEVVDKLNAEVPGLITVYDEQQSSIHTQYLTFLKADGRDAIYLEDDIELCNNFMERAEQVIKELGGDKIINFFSMRKADIEVGTRLEPAGSFLMTQAVYIPGNIAKGCAEFYESGEYTRRNENNKDCDVYIREYMKINKLNYYIYVPNLVDHLQIKSVIDPRRSTKRQSKTFTK